MNSENKIQANSLVKGFNQRLSKYRVESIRSHCRGRFCLDIGCGEGDIIFKIYNIFSEIVGIDITKKYINFARSKNKHKNIRFENCSIDNFFSKNKFNTILMVDVLEHISNPQKTLKKISDLLYRNGYIICIVPNAESLHRRIGKKMGLIRMLKELGKQDYGVGHKRYYDSKSLKNIFRKSGFKIIELEGVFLKPFPNKQMECLDEKYCDALYEIGKMLPEYCAELLIVAKKRK